MLQNKKVTFTRFSHNTPNESHTQMNRCLTFDAKRIVVKCLGYC